jgi:hypothetical protein
MKYLAIECNGIMMVPVTEGVGALLEAVGLASVYSVSGWGSDRKYNPADYKPTITFVDESELNEAPEPLAKLQEQLRDSEKRWMEYYNRATKAEKERDEMKKKLDGVVNAAKDETPF